jgi:competence protein ComEC
MFAVLPPAPAAGELWLTVLDVGQGLAVVARTGNHVLLYDAGPAFNASADSGTRVVLPYLRGEGVARLDALVVSHDDRDHSGGAESVIDGMQVALLWSSLPEDHPLLSGHTPHRACEAGRGWEWDGVTFEFLHPAAPAGQDGRANNRSCVLRIAAPGGRVLLAGDIERAAERELLRRAPGLLAADVLLVPHHGSATSSSAEFVEKVAPRYAVFTVGYRNRFGHPREDVIERYRGAGSALLRTDASGAIEMRLAPQALRVQAERDRSRRYWHEG